ncbi:hypothetical protein AB0C76_17300 [Kitasatospora sp. NPDC048722]|uniref:hypothetical protein n=1 Tax=Kitasatospora sp. NPDC048722 TaxID=3155639 RepID=UPI0033F97114
MPPDAPSDEPRDEPSGPEPGELADLRARLSAVEAHEARLAEELRARPPRHRVRFSFGVLLVLLACLLACLLTPLGAVAVRAKSEVPDTDRYVATTAPLARDPAVRAAVTDRVKRALVDDGPSLAPKVPEIRTSNALVQSDAVPKVRTGLRLLAAAGFRVPVLAVACALGGVRAVHPDALPAHVDQAAAHAVHDALVRYPRSAVRVVVALGLLVALGTWISGSGRRAGTVRGMLRVAERAGLRRGPAGRLVHRREARPGWAAVSGAIPAFVPRDRPVEPATLRLVLGPVGVLALPELPELPKLPGEPGRSTSAGVRGAAGGG